VRLIGVDAPELEGEDGRPEPYAEEAARFTANALEGKDVVLVPGEEETDDYGRLLAYVWTVPEEGLLGSLKRLIGARRPEFFNQKLLREGYAETLTIRPNDAFADCFEAAQRKAQDAGEGIWGPQETSHFEETTSSTYVTSPEPASSESAPESTATTVAEQAITPDDAPEETVYSQEGTARLEQAVTGESGAAIRQQYKDAPPTAPASQDPSEETTSIARRGPTSLPVGSLPVADTPHAGTVPVLPETGGTSLLALFGAMGLISLVLAALSANSSPGDRPNENRDEER
jgi:endonuclease YncB( thermonuclease family)